MSITVATSSVDHAWQEIDAVAFTAGTLADISACVTEIESKLKRGTLSTTSDPTLASVKRWMVRAKETLAAIKNFESSRRFAYVDTVSATYKYALPPDFRGGHVNLRDVTDGETPRRITLWEKVPFDSTYPDPSYRSSDRPDIACIKGRELWLRHPADGTYRLELEYARSGDDNDADDISWLPELYRFMCCDFAIYQAYLAVRDWDAAQIYKQEWMEDIKLARMEDGKHKWSSKRYQCPVWFSRKTLN